MLYGRVKNSFDALPSGKEERIMAWGFRSAISRRTVKTVALACVLCATSAKYAYAQDAAPAAAPPAQAKPDPFKFSADNLIMVWTVKPEKTADFESAWTAIKDKLTKSEKPDLKELGTSINILKVDVPPTAGAPVVYLFHLNPPSKTLTYEPTFILYSSGAFPERPEADAIYNKLKDAIQGMNPWPLKKIGG
jgi:hypothetical protein